MNSETDDYSKSTDVPEEPKLARGLAELLGRWDDGDEFADGLDRVVAARRAEPVKPLPDF